MSEQHCLSIPMLHVSPSGLPNKRRFHVHVLSILDWIKFVKLILLRPRSSFSGTIEVWQNSGLSTKVSGAFSPVLVSPWFFLLFSCVLSRGYGSCRYFPHPNPSRSPPSLNMPYTATASLPTFAANASPLPGAIASHPRLSQAHQPPLTQAQCWPLENAKSCQRPQVPVLPAPPNARSSPYP